MMRLISVFTFTSLILVFLIANTDSQTINRTEANELVKQLSWDSITFNNNVLLSISPKGKIAERLVEIGKPATDALLQALIDEDKALAAHVILTIIWERPIINVVSNDICKKTLFGKKTIGYFQECNGLKWTTLKNGKQEINRKNLIENFSEWQKKINNYRM